MFAVFLNVSLLSFLEKKTKHLSTILEREIESICRPVVFQSFHHEYNMKETNQIFSILFPPIVVLIVIYLLYYMQQDPRGGRMIDSGSEGGEKEKRSPSLFGRCHHHHVTPCSGI